MIVWFVSLLNIKSVNTIYDVIITVNVDNKTFVQSTFELTDATIRDGYHRSVSFEYTTIQNKRVIQMRITYDWKCSRITINIKIAWKTISLWWKRFFIFLPLSID